MSARRPISTTACSARGYRLQEPCTALAKSIAPCALPADVEIGDAPSEAWLGVYLAGITQSRRGLAPVILARVPPPRAFLLLRDQGEPTARRWAWSPRAWSSPNAWQRGPTCADTGQRAASCRRWKPGARKQGATIAALQAVAANAPAQALYAKLDYRRVGGYHYRVLDS